MFGKRLRRLEATCTVCASLIVIENCSEAETRSLYERWLEDHRGHHDEVPERRRAQ